MSLQNILNGRQTPSVIGEFSDDSVMSSRAYICTGTSDERPEIGRMFVFKDASVGGKTRTVASMDVGSAASAPCGVLVNPKEQVVVGFRTETTIPSGSVGTIATRGHIYVWANSHAPVNGEVFVDASGNLGGHSMPDIVAKVINARWIKGVPSSDKPQVAEMSIDLPKLEAAETEEDPTPGPDIPHTYVDPEDETASLSGFLSDVGASDETKSFADVAEDNGIEVTDETKVSEFVDEFRG